MQINRKEQTVSRFIESGADGISIDRKKIQALINAEAEEKYGQQIMRYTKFISLWYRIQRWIYRRRRFREEIRKAVPPDALY